MNYSSLWLVVAFLRGKRKSHFYDCCKNQRTVQRFFSRPAGSICKWYTNEHVSMHRATKWGYSFGIQERITHISSTFCWRNLDFLPEFRILQKCTAFIWTFIMRWHENANWYVPFRFYAFQSYKFQAIWQKALLLYHAWPILWHFLVPTKSAGDSKFIRIHF